MILSERSELPVVSASLVFASGSGANPADMPGLANFTAAMLDEGTKTRNALQIADEAARGSARPWPPPRRWIRSQISVTSLAAQFPRALDLLADVALNPTFPQEEVERQRASRLANLRGGRRATRRRLRRASWPSALYGTAHPYGYTELGTEASNKAMSRAAMVGLLEAAARAGQCRAGRRRRGLAQASSRR